MSQASRPPGSVMHIITGVDVGGAELAMKRLVLTNRSATVLRHVVVSLRDIGTVGQELAAAGIAVHCINMHRGPWSVITGFMKLVAFIRREKPGVIQTWMYHADLLGGLAARLAGRSEIVWGVRQSSFSREDPALTVGVMKLCARLSTRVPRIIVCPAEAAREAHIQWGYAAERFRVIPNGFDMPDLATLPQRRRETRESLGFSDDECVVGMIARFDPLKDHATFIKAAEIVAVRQPKVRFILVGRGICDGNDQLIRWIREAGLRDRFALLGERRDIENCFAAMDVFCLSSVHEGFPNVVAEAMSMSVPCVVTDAGDAARIVGDAGIVVPTRSPAQLADALVKMLSLSPARRQAIGLAARRRVEINFSTTSMLSHFEQAWSAARARAA